jgi:hypothetical protein
MSREHTHDAMFSLKFRINSASLLLSWIICVPIVLKELSRSAEEPSEIGDSLYEKDVRRSCC